MKKLSILLFFLVVNCFSAKLYHNENLIYFWDFESEGSFLSDKKKNVELQQQGKVRWVPSDHSFNESGVVHLHGDKSEGNIFKTKYKKHVN